MADAMADAESAEAVAVKQKPVEVERDDGTNDLGDAGEETIEIQGVAGDGGDFQKKVEQFLALLEALILLGWRHGDQAAVACTILTLALAPMRVAPAAAIALRSSRVRTPPLAFTPISGPTVRRMRAMSWTVAPPGPKPVEVLTKSAPASL